MPPVRRLVLACLLLAACGGSDGELPDITLPSTTSTIAQITTTTSTTEPETTTTTEDDDDLPPVIIVTTTSTSTTTTTTTTTAPTTTTTLELVDDDQDDEAYAWLIIFVLLVAIAIGVLLMSRRRKGASTATWASGAGVTVARGRAIVDAVTRGGSPSHELHAMESELAALLANAPSEPARQAVDVTRSSVAALGEALDGDVRLRIGPPPPTPDQLSASMMLIQERARDLTTSLDRLAGLTQPRA